MHVTLFPLPSGTPFRLTGERPEEGVSAGILTPQRAQSVVPLVESDHGQCEDAGNLVHVPEFTISRTFDSAGEATDYALMHAERVPARCHVQFAIHELDGKLFSIRTLHYATCVPTRITWDGCAVEISYRIAGGKMS